MRLLTGFPPQFLSEVSDLCVSRACYIVSEMITSVIPLIGLHRLALSRGYETNDFASTAITEAFLYIDLRLSSAHVSAKAIE